MTQLTPELVTRLRQELDNWIERRRKRPGPYAAVKERKEHLCACGCGKACWNRTKWAQSCYFRNRRARFKDNAPVEEKVVKLCRCGSPAIAKGRCTSCYHKWIRRNPKVCGCGARYNIKGDQCPRCRLEDVYRELGDCVTHPLRPKVSPDGCYQCDKAARQRRLREKYH